MIGSRMQLVPRSPLPLQALHGADRHFEGGTYRLYLAWPPYSTLHYTGGTHFASPRLATGNQKDFLSHVSATRGPSPQCVRPLSLVVMAGFVTGIRRIHLICAHALPTFNVAGVHALIPRPWGHTRTPVSHLRLTSAALQATISSGFSLASLCQAPLTSLLLLSFFFLFPFLFLFCLHCPPSVSLAGDR